MLLPFQGSQTPPEPDFNQERATTPGSEPLAHMGTSVQAALAQAESMYVASKTNGTSKHGPSSPLGAQL